MSTLREIGRAQARLGAPTAASDALSQSLALAERMGQARSIALARLHLAELAADLGESTAAEEHLMHAIEGFPESDDEPFMNERQRAYFRRKLLAWREEILRSTKETVQHLQDESAQHADIADRASTETERALELRARDRQRKLIAKIDAALVRLDDGTYGYCEETGEPISLKRLDARPIATLSVEAQERHERRERVYRDE